MAGYLYALAIGYNLAPDASHCENPPPVDDYGVHGMSLHVKFGSLRTTDPVSALRLAYSRPFGVPRILWIEPSANAYRDEHQELFRAMRSHRVWPAHEIFSFDNEAHAQTALAGFTEVFRRRTAEDDKPPEIDSDQLVRASRLTCSQLNAERRVGEAAISARLAARLTTAEEELRTVQEREAKRAAKRAAKRQAEQEAENRRQGKESARRQAEQEAAARPQQQIELLRDIVSQNCTIGKKLLTPATALNAIAKNSGVGYGIRNGMASLGFEFVKARVNGKPTNVYTGLQLDHQDMTCPS